MTRGAMNSELSKSLPGKLEEQDMRPGPTRRDGLKSLPLSVAGFAGCAKSIAAASMFQAPNPKQGWIDVHNHMLPF